MKRKDFLRNAMMALAIAFVPKVLQPAFAEIVEEEMVDIPIVFYYADNGGIKYRKDMDGKFTIRVTKAMADQIQQYQS